MITLTWLGQASFRIQAGLDLLIDPYLSNSVFEKEGFQRLTPPPFSASELKPDLVLLSHHHLDHTDPDTLKALLGDPLFAGPPSSCQILEEIGVPPTRIGALQRGESWEYMDLQIEATFASHTEDSLGFILKLAGQRIYFTGDTLFSPELAEDKGYLELLIACINGKLGNMNLQEAAKLTSQLKPRKVLPMHWGLFAENTADPLEFAGAVKEEVPQCEVLMPQVGVPIYLN